MSKKEAVRVSRCSHAPTFSSSEKCIASEKLYLAELGAPPPPLPPSTAPASSAIWAL